MERVRESLFAILAPWIDGVRFLDLFAGGGSIGLEALSRGASEAVFVDTSRGCAEAIRENLALMEMADRAYVIARPWKTALAQLSRHSPFHIVFADPPYEDERILFEVAERVVQHKALHPGGLCIFQHTVRLALPNLLSGELTRVDSRRFGETMLTFYRAVGPSRDSSLQDLESAEAAGPTVSSPPLIEMN